jgi:DNA-binding CsgD family transcriptional regulator
MRALVHHDPADFEAALEEHRSWGNRFEEAAHASPTVRGLGVAGAGPRLASSCRRPCPPSAPSARPRGKKRARDELDAAGARLPRTASKVPLTPQEERIAQLVAEGLTNKDIALHLVISTKTVEGHLRNIFEKLGVRSRTQVARAVSE